MTYPPSYSNSPIELIYQNEHKRNMLFHSQNSNPERHSQLSKSGDSNGQQDLRHIPVQPNVAVQMQYGLEKNKFSTPTHQPLNAKSYNEAARMQASHAPIDKLRRKDSDHMTSSRNTAESPIVTTIERRVNVQQPATVVVTKTVSVNGSPFNGRPEQPNFRSSCTFTHIPLTNSRAIPGQQQNPLRSSVTGAIRLDGNSPTVGPFSKGSPNANAP